MKMLKKLLFVCILVLAPALMTLADPPGPPPPGGDPSLGGTPVGAPIDGGISILLALGIGYGTRKIYHLRKKE